MHLMSTLGLHKSKDVRLPPKLLEHWRSEQDTACGDSAATTSPQAVQEEECTLAVEQ
jgi:hypothetical protein